MALAEPTDSQLLSATDTRSFELFYRRHFEPVLGFFARRTRDAELAADLAAETFAAALSARSRYRPERGRADSWLFAIAYHKLADAQRRGAADDRARRRLAMERIELTDVDVRRIERLAGENLACRPSSASRPTSARRSGRTSSAAAATRRSPTRSTSLRRGPQARQPRARDGAQADRRAAMTIELEDRLWAQLEAAADRNARRGRVARGSELLRRALPPAVAVAAVPLWPPRSRSS